MTFDRLRSLRAGGLFIALVTTTPLSPALGGDPSSPVVIKAGIVDLRPLFTDWGLPLRLQGARPTCSVFTVAGALEYALASQQHRRVPLSVEFLNWASNEATKEADDGSFFSDLWKGVVAYGLCPEADMPYENRFDTKRRPSEAALQKAKGMTNSGLQLHWIKPWDVKTGLTEAQFAEIKTVLSNQWPVCGGFRWPKQERWDLGVLRMTPPDGVVDGHSVLLVGFRDDPQQAGGGVFLIRNSGRSVHDGAMPYEFARAYMNDALWVDYPATNASSASLKRNGTTESSPPQGTARGGTDR
jgi:hypothetical protein